MHDCGEKDTFISTTLSRRFSRRAQSNSDFTRQLCQTFCHTRYWCDQSSFCLSYQQSLPHLDTFACYFHTFIYIYIHIYTYILIIINECPSVYGNNISLKPDHQLWWNLAWSSPIFQPWFVESFIWFHP